MPVFYQSPQLTFNANVNEIDDDNSKDDADSLSEHFLFLK